MNKFSALCKRVYPILLSLSVVLAGIALATQCLSIYRSGDRPFTPETVAAAFAEIAVPVYFCGFMVLLGLFLKPLFPQAKTKGEKNYDLILSRLEATVDLNACPKELESAVVKLLVRRTLVQSIGWGLLAMGSLVFLLYGANPGNFHTTDINNSMIDAMLWLIPAMAIPFGYGIFAVYYRKSSIQKEINLLKTAPAAAKHDPEPASAKPDRTALIRWTVLTVALLFIVGGYFLNGAVDVLTKAVNICTECIGLG